MNVRSTVLCALFAALTAICAWLSIPVLDICYTMQSFAVFLALGTLGGKWGCISIATYLLLGLIGLPVFSGFQGGAGVLLGVTGGYIWGFLLGGLAYWVLERLGKLPAMAACLVICYACGTLWFSVYTGTGTGIWAVLLKCVFPYLLPDLAKLLAANTLATRLRRHLPAQMHSS